MMLSAILGGLITRWHGSKLPGPRWLIHTLWAFPFAMTAPGCPFLIALCFLASFGGLATGHSRGQSMTEPLRGTPEKVEILTLWAWSSLSDYWYKVFIMTVWGLATVSGGVIGFLSGHHFASAGILMLGGILCAPGYMLGWKLQRHLPFGLEPTQIGEFLTGFFGYGALCIAMGAS